jgi:hypothetical protein
MDGYDNEEVLEIGKEIDNLHTAWMMYLNEEENGRNAHLHFPPALFTSVIKLAESLTNEPVSLRDLDLDQACTTTLKGLANFAATVFEWAQLAARNGVLVANMTPCNCHQITDDDLRSLIGGNDGEGNNRSA